MAKKKEYVDSVGNRVIAKYVPKYEQQKDAIAERIFARWKKAEEMLRRVKLETMKDIEAVRVLAIVETDAKKLGGEKGNLQFRSFDGTITISLDIQARSEFDERLNIAQQLIMEAVREMLASSEADLVEIATKAFQPRKSGKLDMQRIRDLRHYKVSHPKWRKACEIISDCERTVGTRQYIRVAKRYTADAKPENVFLDIAAV